MEGGGGCRRRSRTWRQEQKIVEEHEKEVSMLADGAACGLTALRFVEPRPLTLLAPRARRNHTGRTLGAPGSRGSTTGQGPHALSLSRLASER